MKLPVKCANCGHKDVAKIYVVLLILLCLTIIGGIIYYVIIYKKYLKCPKCGCVMDQIHNVSTSNDTKKK